MPTDSDEGFVNGQLYADELVDRGTIAAMDLNAELEKKIAAELEAATSYDDLRSRLLALFAAHDVEPAADLVFKTMVMAELAGRAAVNEDI